MVANVFVADPGSGMYRAADINGDGAVNSIDSNLIRRKISGN
ncbi:MAG: hypothetical protein IJD22_04075 [Clostridia bacterium]|nr:hypothetical protein [Clostridia bacterium]